MLYHQWRDRWNLDHLVTQRLKVVSLPQGAAAAAGIRVVIHHLADTLDRQQFRLTAGMTLLAAPLGATAFAAFGRLKSLRKNSLRGRAFPLAELIGSVSLLDFRVSAVQAARWSRFGPVLALPRALFGHTSGHPSVHAVAVAGFSRLPRRIRL